MDKPFWQSKGVWAGLLLIVSALYQMVATGTIDLSSIQTALLGLGVVGIRQAIE